MKKVLLDRFNRRCPAKIALFRYVDGELMLRLEYPYCKLRVWEPAWFIVPIFQQDFYEYAKGICKKSYQKLSRNEPWFRRFMEAMELG